MIDQPRMRV